MSKTAQVFLNILQNMRADITGILPDLKILRPVGYRLATGAQAMEPFCLAVVLNEVKLRQSPITLKSCYEELVLCRRHIAAKSYRECQDAQNPSSCAVLLEQELDITQLTCNGVVVKAFRMVIQCSWTLSDRCVCLLLMVTFMHFPTPDPQLSNPSALLFNSNSSCSTISYTIQLQLPLNRCIFSPHSHHN